MKFKIIILTIVAIIFLTIVIYETTYRKDIYRIEQTQQNIKSQLDILFDYINNEETFGKYDRDNFNIKDFNLDI